MATQNEATQGLNQRTGRYKHKVVAGVLAIFLGGFGIHRFYLGQWWGLFYLLFCWTLIPGLVSFVEGIVFLLANQDKWDLKFNEGNQGSGESSGALIALVVVGVAFVCLTFIGMLAAVTIPAYQDYTIRAKVLESANLSSPHRTALGVACAEKTLVANANNEDYGLAAPERYSGPHTKSISISVQSETQAEVTIVYPAIGSAIKDGQTTIYRGACGPGGMIWTAEGTIKGKYLPKT